MANDAPVTASTLPNPDSLLRLYQIIGDEKRGIHPLIPVSRSLWYVWIKDGKAPKPTKIGEKINGWKAGDIYSLMKTLSK